MADPKPYLLVFDGIGEGLVEHRPGNVEEIAKSNVEEIAKTILAWSTRERSAPSKNLGGWKSSETLFALDRPEIETLSSEIGEYVFSYTPIGRGAWDGRMHAWAMVNREGAEHPRHQHYRTRATGIFYVTAGDPVQPTPTMFEAAIGDVQFYGPPRNEDGIREVAERGITEIAIDPRPGRLVLFPGSMWHRVPRVKGEAPRITIAFDVRY